MAKHNNIAGRLHLKFRCLMRFLALRFSIQLPYFIPRTFLCQAPYEIRASLCITIRGFGLVNRVVNRVVDTEKKDNLCCGLVKRKKQIVSIHFISTYLLAQN